MILLAALLAGLLTGWAMARLQKRAWALPPLRALWLVIAAFLPQYLAFYLPATRAHVPDRLASAALILSQFLLLVFCWLNRRIKGIWPLALGTALNLTVIALNGGFMPISPQTAGQLTPAGQDLAGTGVRFGIKDILLLPADTRLAWLSDCLLSPKVGPYRLAFSPGDIAIAAGAFWLTVGERKKNALDKHKDGAYAGDDDSERVSRSRSSILARPQ
jgi:hypothetical protein